MPDLTAKGVPYANPADPNDLVLHTKGLADSATARPGVSALTSAARDALAGSELWDGRVILNLTTGQGERYDAGNNIWRTLVSVHEGAADPHPQYLTAAEADALFLTPAEGDALFLTPAEGDALFLTPAEGVQTAGGSTITSSAAGVKGLVVKGASGQTANTIEVQNDAGTALARVSASGAVVSEKQGLFGPGAAGAFGAGPAGLGVQPQTAAGQGLVVRGASGQAANLAEFQNSAGTVVASVEASGGINAGPLIRVNTTTDLGSYVQVVSTITSAKGLVIRGASGQTGNLAEFQNSAGTTLLGVNPTGRIYVNTASGATSASASAGGAGALPGTPAGYLEVVIDATTRKLPYYAA